MASVHGFNSWSEILNYIENTLGIKYTEDPTSWENAFKAEMEGSRFIKIINDVTGVESEQIVPESLYEGVGEFHTGENYHGQTVSGGGAKSAPTAKSIITENSGSSGGTAVITDEAIGVKDTGLVTFNTPINVISGIMQVFGLVHAGVQIANAQIWKDMSNYVYGTDFTEDTPMERVVDFLKMRVTNCIVDHYHYLTDDELRISVPETIAKRLYEFMASHMIEEQTPGIDYQDSFRYLYGFYQRVIELANPATYTLERYKSVFNTVSDVVAVESVDIGDDLFKYAVSDYLQQLLGSGFLVAESVATALIASMNGIYQFLKDQSVDAVENADYCTIDIMVYRGATPPPATTPISLSEFRIHIRCRQDDTLQRNYAGRIEVNGADLIPPHATGAFPALASGYSYEAGDMVQYLKRGHDGSDPDHDYAYLAKPNCRAAQSGDVKRSWIVNVTYPSNEQSLEYLYYAQDSTANTIGINGFGFTNQWFGGDFLVQPTSDTSSCNKSYSNLGYVGSVVSYMPDDYLTTAGIRSKVGADGNPEKHPNPNQTLEERYPEMNNKKQNARPQAEVDPVTGAVTVTNNISNYVPAAVPSGSTNADILINNGLNNPDNPNSYIDNRPQSVKIEGQVNTDDPVDGINEDIDEAVKKYDDSRNDPNHYPDPIPANEPNPKYPTNPPSEPSGENDDPTDPSVLPGVTASGMVSVYNPTKAEVISFSSWLWTGNVFENIKKLLQDPMEAIIGMHVIYATPHTTTPSNIIVGWLDSGVSAKVVDKQYTQLDCGDVFVPEYYGDVLDYEPYVHIHMYLPFVGIVSLKPNDVIGKLVNVTYGIDALTGTCLAMVTTTKGNSKIQCYTFPGNCAVQVPLTGGNYANIIRGISSMAVGVAGSVATGNILGAVGGAIGGVMASHLDVSHSGTLGANAGAMGVKKPYIIITRKIAYDAAGYNQFYGYPANKTVILGSCKGYTRVKAVHIESIPIATSDEKQEIETLLKQGVIIR